MIKYAIFDLDGTLIDTEGLYRKSWIIMSRKYGLENPEEVYEGVVGAPVSRLKEILRENYGDRVDPDAFYAERTQCALDLFESEGIALKAGCIELLEFLKVRGIPCAVATSTPIHISGKNIENAGIKGYFRDIVTSRDVAHGKPAPDIFLEAGRRIGAVAAETIVVEDSNNGILGAHRAGMKPIYVFDRQLLSFEAEMVTYKKCSSLSDIMDIVKSED